MAVLRNEMVSLIRMLTHKLKQYSTELIHQGLHRQRLIIDLNKDTINFSSNDYLSLASDPRIKNAYQKGFTEHAAGSGGSMVVCGYHATHNALERAFADALNVDDCIIFPSGYAANLSVIGLLKRFDTHIVIDKGVHASIYDGLQCTNASYTRYLHNNLGDLAVKIKTSPKNTVIMTEGIFSMSGECAPLNDMSYLEQTLIVDEAHAFGVLGREGLGSVVQHQLSQQKVPLRVIPLGKAYAASGAIVAGQGVWIDALLQTARPHIYSTAISPAFAYGLLQTLDIVRGADERRNKLRELIDYFHIAIKHSPLQWRDSNSPIQQLQLGSPHRALHYAEKLREQSIVCLPMRQPTVSKRETGLRVILNYQHQHEHIDALFNCLHQL